MDMRKLFSLMGVFMTFSVIFSGCGEEKSISLLDGYSELENSDVLEYAEKRSDEPVYFVQLLDNCYVSKDGSFYRWGDFSGQQNITDLKLEKITEDVISVYTDNSMTSVLTGEGILYTWGHNYEGKLGNGTLKDSNNPEFILENVASFEFYESSATAVTNDGSLYRWGYNGYGSIGNGDKGNGREHTPLKPTMVLDDVVSFEAYDDGLICITGAIKEDGSLYMWGVEGRYGLTPKKVLDHVVSVKVNSEMAAAITEDGSLYIWNHYDYDNNVVPKKVLGDVEIIELYEDNCAYALTTDGSLYMWGYNGEGQIGIGERLITVEEPVKILENVIDVKHEISYSDSGPIAALTEDGILYMWGSNENGQIGNGTNDTVWAPEKILENVIQVESSSHYTAVITKENNLYMWGLNNSGQVGNGTTKDVLMPEKILQDVDFVQLSISNTAAVTIDGSLYMWGANGFGQVGNGTTENVLVPEKVLNNVSLINLDDYLVTAVVNDNDLYTWGNKINVPSEVMLQ